MQDMSKTQVLEINLISAQGLKVPSANLRRMQTHALIWVDSSTKLRTRIDRFGGENPIWNDKFLFRVTPEFLSSEISGVSVEIYAAGCIRDHLIGTVRFLTSNLLSSISAGASESTPAFTAFQIRRPSGRFYGVMNISAMLLDGSDLPALNGISAIPYRELMGKSFRSLSRRDRRRSSKENGDCFSAGSCDNSCSESGDYSDGCESSTSSSSTTSTALRDWNGIRDLAGNKDLRMSNSVGFLCGLLTPQKKTHLTPSDRNRSFSGTHDTGM
ncbi:Calcium-dependent lipid-binding domain-containing protein [Quillaja saponaria]|uniref:Calcium-dependent lipid-binding domain-containing protein n=1 Tax=Quillaja saponaria TaxID=32244 RepID=A0AAD7PNX0_QUISA|nr:Calcium-dependent lipid-binding domain-containing protein [Quillaja saponaria]